MRRWPGSFLSSPLDHRPGCRERMLLRNGLGAVGGARSVIGPYRSCRNVIPGSLDWVAAVSRTHRVGLRPSAGGRLGCPISCIGGRRLALLPEPGGPPSLAILGKDAQSVDALTDGACRLSRALITCCVNNASRYHRMCAAILPGQGHRSRLAPEAVTEA